MDESSEPESKPDAEKEMTAMLHAINADAELVECLRRMILDSSQPGSEGHEMSLKINAMVIGSGPGATCGAVITTIMWLSRSLARDLKMDETVVLASMCSVMLQIQRRLVESKKISEN